MRVYVVCPNLGCAMMQERDLPPFGGETTYCVRCGAMMTMSDEVGGVLRALHGATADLAAAVKGILARLDRAEHAILAGQPMPPSEGSGGTG